MALLTCALSRPWLAWESSPGLEHRQCRPERIRLHRAQQAARLRLHRSAESSRAHARVVVHDLFRVAFVVDIADPTERTATQWVRAIFNDAPQTLRLRLWTVWIMLGFRLGSPFSRTRVLGWELERVTPDGIVLAARPHIGMPAQLLCAGIEPTHGLTVPMVLKEFRRRMEDA